MLVDLHAKSSFGNGALFDVTKLLKRAKKNGLDAVAFVESEQTRHANELIELGRAVGILVFMGIEVVTDSGCLLLFPPKIDEFLLEETWKEIQILRTPDAEYVIEMIKNLGGAVVASKPYELEGRHVMGDRLFLLKGLDAIEVFNPQVGYLQSDFAQEAAQSLLLPTTGGSDPRQHLKDVGAYATFFERKFETQEEFVKALRGDHYWSVKIGAARQERTTRPNLEPEVAVEQRVHKEVPKRSYRRRNRRRS